MRLTLLYIKQTRVELMKTLWFKAQAWGWNLKCARVKHIDSGFSNLQILWWSFMLNVFAQI